MAVDKTYLLSQGKVFIAGRIANGAQNTGFTWVGDADVMQLTTTQKFDDIEESYTGNRLVAAHLPIGTSMAFKLNCLQIDTANLARAYYGANSGAVTGAAVSTEPITLYNGQTSFTKNPGISAVTTAVGVVTTDWVLDGPNGGLTVPTTSSIVVAGTPVVTTVNYTFATYTGRVDAFMAPAGEFYIRVQGFNTANGNAPFLANLYRGYMDMAKMLDLIANKHTALELSGMLLPDSTAPSGQSQFFSIVKA